MDNNNQEENQIYEIYEVDEKKKFKKIIIVFILALFVLVGSLFTYNRNFVHNNKYAFKFNDVKVERIVVDKLKENFESDEEIAYFIMDTLTYAKMAEERGIEVTEEEIEKVNEEFAAYQKEIALSKKLLEVANEKTKNLTEDQLKGFYEETKDSYVKKGTVKFLGLNSKEIIDPTTVLTEEEIKEYPVNEKTIEELLTGGLLPTDLELNKFVLVDIANEEQEESGMYKYIYIFEKDVTEYASYEESKEYLKIQYDRLYGASSVLEAAYAVQQNTTVEYFN